MGITSLLLGPTNPLSQFVGQNKNVLGAWGAGLAAGPTFQQGLSKAVQLGAQAGPADQAEALRQQNLNQTIEWMRSQGYDDLVSAAESGAPIGDIYNEAFRRSRPGGGAEPPSSVQEYQFAKENGFTGTFADWMQTGRNGAAGPQLGLQPQWAYDPKTERYVMGQMSSTGQFQPTEMNGLTPVTPYDINAQRSGGQAFGKQAGAAQFDLPRAELTAQQTISAINDIRGQTAGMAEQFGNIAGVPQQLTPAWPGSEKAKFQVAVDRATNRAFLEARQMLKGGGQITDFESRKAETAITNMQLAMEKGDQAQFEKALDDFEAAVRDGYGKLQQQASSMPGFGGQAGAPATPPGGTTSTGLPWSIE